MYVGESSKAEPVAPTRVNVAIDSHTGETRGNLEYLTNLGVHLKVGNGTPEVRSCGDWGRSITRFSLNNYYVNMCTLTKRESLRERRLGEGVNNRYNYHFLHLTKVHVHVMHMYVYVYFTTDFLHQYHFMWEKLKSTH